MDEDRIPRVKKNLKRMNMSSHSLNSHLYIMTVYVFIVKNYDRNLKNFGLTSTSMVFGLQVDQLK